MASYRYPLKFQISLALAKKFLGDFFLDMISKNDSILRDGNIYQNMQWDQARRHVPFFDVVNNRDVPSQPGIQPVNTQSICVTY